MITGAHILFYSTNPEADREFFRDVLEFRAIDIGRGWMIFALPPAEAAVHPGDGEFSETHAGHQMMGALVYLMCDRRLSTIPRDEGFAGRTKKKPRGCTRLFYGCEVDEPYPRHWLRS